MANTDYYKTLGVSRNASHAEIKKQYRRLARKYHPDVSKMSNAEARFKEVNEAYDVLKDKEKRSNYDSFGSAQGNPYGGGGFTPPPNGGSGNFGGFGQGDFSDIFDNMFKNARGGQFNDASFSQQGARQSYQQNGPVKGENQTIKISVPLEDAYSGANRTINIRIPGESANKKL
ncbi:MAG: J domain-containing protein, partial [Thiotrichaceae bacterium]|nr:J domain-containing protein [Thiotrichaceae bacterium]